MSEPTITSEEQYKQSYALLAPYFSFTELACPLSHTVKLAPNFFVFLRDLRTRWNRPMKVGGCCRSYDYQQQLTKVNTGAAEHSLHVWDKPFHPTDGCAAIDIDLDNGKDMFDLATLAFQSGWCMGVATWGLHLDRRMDFGLAGPVLFGYK